MSPRTATGASLLLFLTMLGACATIGGGRRFDPSGTWDFATNYEGQALSGTITLERDQSGAWTGSILTPLAEEVWTGIATMEGRTVRMSFDTGEDVVTVDLQFPTDDALTGTWTTSTASGRLTGTRRG